jgi:MYXO-CTERM domain-containing protein
MVRPRRLGWIGAAALAALSPRALLAADLHVGAGQAYATVQAAVSAAEPGDAVLVHAGSYVEDLSFSASGTDAARIALRPAGDGAVTIEGAHDLEGDYWDIEGVTLQGRAGADCLQVRGDHNRILGVDMTGGDRDGIDGGGIGNEVRGSAIHGFDGGMSDAHCIVLNPGAEDWVIDDNQLYDCSGDSVQLYSATAERTIRNVEISNNVMSWTGAIMRMENAVDIKNADGLRITGNLMSGFTQNKTIVAQKGPIGIRVECNVMHSGFTGVELRAEDGGVVEDITFARNLMHDFSDYALKLDGVVGANVYNNTFVAIGSDGLRIEGGGVTNGTVRNNLWSNTGNIDPGSYTADHNAFWMTGGVGVPSPTDVLLDPQLDAAYELAQESPLIDAGADVGLPFAGASPDIGWHEVGLDACGEVPGEGGGGSGPGPGSTAASSGSGGAVGGATSGAGGGGSGADEGDEGGGCSCRAGDRTGGTTAAWILAAVAVLARRRKRA